MSGALKPDEMAELLFGWLAPLLLLSVGLGVEGPAGAGVFVYGPILVGGFANVGKMGVEVVRLPRSRDPAVHAFFGSLGPTHHLR